MEKNLSKLQKDILQIAYNNGCERGNVDGIDITIRVALIKCYCFTVNEKGDFDRQTISRKAYHSAYSAVSRSLTRLMDRDLITYRGEGYTLTERGVDVVMDLIKV